MSSAGAVAGGWYRCGRFHPHRWLSGQHCSMPSVKPVGSLCLTFTPSPAVLCPDKDPRLPTSTLGLCI